MIEPYNPNKSLGKEYLPIPYGGAKLVIALVVGFIVVQFLASLGNTTTLTPGLITLVAGFAAWPVVFGQSFFKWSGEYWQRNVRGCRAVYFKYSHPEPASHLSAEASSPPPEPVLSVEVRSGRNLARCYPHASVVIPLGGWRRKRFLVANRASYTYWKVVGHKFHYGKLEVVVQDRWKDRLTLDVKLIHWLLDNNLASISLAETFGNGYCRSIDLEAQLLESDNRSEARRGIIFDTIGALAESKTRFGRSQEAQRMKEELARRFLPTLSKREEWQRPFLEKCLPKPKRVTVG